MKQAHVHRTAAFRAIVGIAVFAAWLGGALFHFHDSPAPTCKVCQALQANQADLAAQGSVSRPALTHDRIASPAAPQAIPADLLIPQGRAPPLA